MCPNGISVEKYCPTCGQRFQPGDEAVKCTQDDAILLPVTRDEFIGKVIDGKFELLQFIGAGASSLVYRARQTDLSRMVAFKLLRTDLVSSALKIQRFSQEARLVGRLNHPNICRVFDFGILNSGQPYLVLEFVEGKSLSNLLEEEQTLPLPRAIHLLKEIAQGLQEAHARGVMHRDLKPSNIMVVDGSHHESVKLIDFGLAKTFELDREGQLTSSGYLIGTPSYMSPEQVLGKSLDARTDIYSLGCIFYEMVTGRKAVEGGTAFEIMSKHLRNDPQRIMEQDLHIPREIQRLTLKCMDKDPNRRYQSAQKLLEALSNADGTDSRFGRQELLRRLRSPKTPIAVPIVAALAAIAVSSWFSTHPAVAPGPHRQQHNNKETALAMLTELNQLESQNQLDGAEALGKKTFDWLKAHGKQHSPEMIELGRTMQRIYGRQVRTQESPVYIRAVFAAQQALAARAPAEHKGRLLGDAWREAGVSLLVSNADKEALYYLTNWLRKVENTFGSDSRQCVEPLRKLCQAEASCHLKAETDRDCRRLITLCSRHYAADKPMQVTVLLDACGFYFKIGDTQKASQLADQCIDLSADTATETRTHIFEKAALCAAGCGDFKKASRLIRQAIETHEADAKQENSRDDLQLLVLEGRYLREAKLYRQAEETARRAVLQAANHDTESNLYKWALEEYTKVLDETGKKQKANSIRKAGKLD